MLARQQEVFAGFLTHTDAQIGRVLNSLERLGALENTLVLVFSDNGASAEGGKEGSVNEMRFTAHLRESLADNLAHYDDWGGFKTYNHYSWGWAWAGNTPHKLWKRYTWLGGTRTPLIVNWGGRVAGPGAARTQFAHAIDLMPTVLEAVGVEVPDEVDGVAQQRVDGVSLLATLADPATAEQHHTQYFEMLGSRSIYHDGWKATTNHISTGVLDEEELAVGSRRFDDDRWELFDLGTDFSEAHDRAADEPERVRHLTDLWAAEAGRNNVLPISDGLVDRFGGFIPPVWPPGSSRTYLPGGGPVFDESVPLLWGGFRLTAAVEMTAAADGVICALGDWFGGYALYASGTRCTSPSPARRMRSSSQAHPWAPGRSSSACSTRRATTVRVAWPCSSTASRSTRPASRGPCPLRSSTAAPGCAWGTTAGSRSPPATGRPLPSTARCTG